MRICVRSPTGCVHLCSLSVKQCVCVAVFYSTFPETVIVLPRISVASTAIDHVCLRSLGRASPKHNTWIIKQPVKKMNELNKPALAVRASTNKRPYTLAHTHTLNRSLVVGFPQTVNEHLPGFHFHRGFFCAGKSCVWLITVGLECTPSWPD